MPREQARFSLATWRNHEISASRRVRVSEQSGQTCVEDRAPNDGRYKRDFSVDTQTYRGYIYVFVKEKKEQKQMSTYCRTATTSLGIISLKRSLH